MLIWISKFGIIISLVMVAHALFYPNKFSLIIAIFGYIIAIVFAVIFGLSKSSTKSSTNLQEVELKSFADHLIDTFREKIHKSNPPEHGIWPNLSDMPSVFQASNEEKNIKDMINQFSKDDDLSDEKGGWIKDDEDLCSDDSYIGYN